MSGCRNRSRTRQRVCIPWTPFGRVDLQQYFDAADERSVPPGTPSQIFDLSGKNKHSTSRAGFPTVVIHPVIGRSMLFSGSNGFIHNAGPGSNYGYSFAICYPTVLDASNHAIYTAQPGGDFKIWMTVRNNSNNTASGSWNTGSSYSLGATTPESFVGIINRYSNSASNNPAVIRGSLNGVYSTPASTASVYGDGVTRCGVGFDGTGWGFKGNVACCGFVQTAALATDYEMQRMEGFLYWSHKVERFLAANHPFKLKPPMAGD